MTANDSPPSPDQLEEVFNSIDAVEVGMARDLLESSGMECFVFDASASQMLGSTAAITVRLMVRAEDAVEAREALKELGF
jgi:Putative prokaryotic signal transducing protein